MADLTEAFHTALHLIATLDPELIGIVLLSLKVSLTAVTIGLWPSIAFPAAGRFPRR